VCVCVFRHLQNREDRDIIVCAVKLGAIRIRQNFPLNLLCYVASALTPYATTIAESGMESDGWRLLGSIHE
jgi:hypothetical protein